MNKSASAPLTKTHRASVPGSASETSRSNQQYGGGGLVHPTREQPRGRRNDKAVKWIARMFCNRVTVVVFGMLLVHFTSGCMVAGEKEVNPVTGANRTAFVAMLGTDAGTLPMPYRNADGTLAEATEVNQSKGASAVVTGVVSGMAVKAYEAVQTGAQGVDRALSKDGTSAAMNADNNATRAAINADNNALKEAELFSGQ